MKKIIGPCLICFILGFFVAKSFNAGKCDESYEKEEHHHDKKEACHNTNKQSAVEVLASQKNDDRKERESFSKHKRKYFKKEKGLKGKISTLLNRAGHIDHRVKDGEPNMDLIDLYEEILSLDPLNIQALNRYSNYMIILGRYEEGKKLVDKCLQADPNHPACLGNSVNHFLNDGKQEEVNKRVDDCLEKSPMNVQCLYTKAQSLILKGNGKQGLAYLKKLEKHNGRNYITFNKGVIYFAYGQAYEQMKDIEKAKQYFEDACSEGEEYACTKVKDYR